MLDVRDVTIGFGGRPLLDGLTLRLDAGEVVAVQVGNEDRSDPVGIQPEPLQDLLDHGMVALFGALAGPFAGADGLCGRPPGAVGKQFA